MEKLSDIFKSIKRPETPWKVKLKYAAVLNAEECHFPYKNQVVLEWACQELVYNSKNDCHPDEMLAELWRIISEILQNAELEKKSNTLVLRPTFIEMLMNEFQTTRCHSVSFIKCCSIIYKNPDYYGAAIHKYDKFVQYLINALKSVPVVYEVLMKNMDLNPGSTKEQFAVYFQLIFTLVQIYLSLQKQQNNLIKVAVDFNEKLLKEIAVWKGFISKLHETVGMKVENVKSKELLTQCLWNRETMTSIKGKVHLYGKDDTGGGVTSWKFALLDSLFKTIENCVITEKPDLVYDSMTEFVPEIFHSFLSASREKNTLPKHFEFTIFRKFCTAIFKSVSCSNDVNEDETPQSIECIRRILRILLDFKVFTVTDDTVNTVHNKQFLQNITNVIMSILNERPTQLMISSLGALECLVELDRSLVHSHILNILKDTLVIEGSHENQKLLGNAKDSLLRTLLESHVRTRQIEDFIIMLLAALHASKERIELNSTVIDRLKFIAEGLPVRQSLAIIQTIVEEISSKYLSQNTDSTPKRLSLKNFDVTIQKLTILADLLQTFSLQIHILPSNGYYGQNQQRFLELFESIKSTVILPLISMLQNNNREGKRKGLFTTAWRFINIYQCISLFLLDHGLISSPLFRLFNGDVPAELLLSPSKISQSFIDGLSAGELNLYIQSVCLYTRQSIFLSDEEECRHCLEHISDFISYLESIDDTEATLVRNGEVGVVFIEEIPWLGSFIGKGAMSKLCTIFLNTIMRYIMSNPIQMSFQKKLEQSNQSKENRLHFHDGIYQRHIQLLSSPSFYDDHVMQTCFCNGMLEKLRKIDLFVDFSNSFEKLSEEIFATKNDIEEMGLDDANSTMEISTESSPFHDVNTNLATSCNFLMKNIFDTFARGVCNENKAEDTDCNMSSVHWVLECHAILETMNSMRFKWLIPASAAALLLLTLIIHSKSAPKSQAVASCADISRKIISILEKYTSSTIAANRNSIWKIIDPVLLLQFLLCVIKDMGTDNEVPDEVFKCTRNLCTIILDIKRNKDNEDEFCQLKNDMLAITKNIWRDPSYISINVLNSLLIATADAVQGRVVKKKCWLNCSLLTYPIIKQMISEDLKTVISDYRHKISCKEAHQEWSINHEIFYRILRCYGYAFAICFQIKSAGKDTEFIATLQSSKLDYQIRVITDIIRTEIGELENDVEDKSMLKEEVCLELLGVLLLYNNFPETSHLGQVDFCEPVCSCLFRILEEKQQKQLGETNRDSYFKIIAYCLNSTNDDVANCIMERICQRMASNLNNGKLLEVSLELLCYVFSTKFTKERKKSLLESLITISYINIQALVLENHEQPIIVKTYECISSLLAFSKDILMPAHASAVLQAILNPSASKPGGLFAMEILHKKVKLLDVLLFNHTKSMIGAIATFKLALDRLLTEFAMIIKSNKHEEKDAIKVCDGIMRLYQEIAGHKEAVSRFARYFIADYLSMIASHAVHEQYQKLLSAGIYTLMDICPNEDFAYLSTVLPDIERDLFKDLYNSFTKHHKFQGKA